MRQYLLINLACRTTVHTECQKLVSLTCHDVKKLQSANTLYFLANTTQEKNMWMRGLDYYRRLLERYEQETNSVKRSSYVLS